MGMVQTTSMPAIDQSQRLQELQNELIQVSLAQNPRGQIYSRYVQISEIY